MTINIIVPTPLRPGMDNQDEVTVEFEGSVSELLQQLVESYPKVKPYVYDDNNELRKFINLYVNGIDIRDLEAAQTVLKAGDELSIVPSIAGGCA